MKKSRLLLMSSVLTLAFASCGNDGDGDSGIQVRNFFQDELKRTFG